MLNYLGSILEKIPNQEIEAILRGMNADVEDTKEDNIDFLKIFLENSYGSHLCDVGDDRGDLFYSLDMGLNELWDTEIEAIAILMGADHSIGKGFGEEHRKFVIDFIHNCMIENSVNLPCDVQQEPINEYSCISQCNSKKSKPVKPSTKVKTKKPAKVAWTPEQYKTLSVADLKAYAKESGSKCTGTKAVLIEGIMNVPWNKFKSKTMEDLMAIFENDDDLDPEEILAEAKKQWDELDEDAKNEFL